MNVTKVHGTRKNFNYQLEQTKANVKGKKMSERGKVSSDKFTCMLCGL